MRTLVFSSLYSSRQRIKKKGIEHLLTITARKYNLSYLLHLMFFCKYCGKMLENSEPNEAKIKSYFAYWNRDRYFWLSNLKVIWQLWLINLNISFVVVITLKFQSEMKTVKKFCGAFPLSKKVLFFVCEENLDRNEKWYNFSLFSHCSKTFYFL